MNKTVVTREPIEERIQATTYRPLAPVPCSSHVWSDSSWQFNLSSANSESGSFTIISNSGFIIIIAINIFFTRRYSY
ncbi:unnamed protein product [Calypogeia fissa]